MVSSKRRRFIAAFGHAPPSKATVEKLRNQVHRASISLGERQNELDEAERLRMEWARFEIDGQVQG